MKLSKNQIEVIAKKFADDFNTNMEKEVKKLEHEIKQSKIFKSDFKKLTNLRQELKEKDKLVRMVIPMYSSKSYNTDEEIERSLLNYYLDSKIKRKHMYQHEIVDEITLLTIEKTSVQEIFDSLSKKFKIQK